MDVLDAYAIADRVNLIKFSFLPTTRYRGAANLPHNIASGRDVQTLFYADNNLRVATDARRDGKNMETEYAILDYTSAQIRDMLDTIYQHSLTTNLLIWEAIQRGQDELVWEEKINSEDKKIAAEAKFDGGILKVTVRDVLPRRKNDVPASLLRLYWMGSVAQAVRNLGVPVSFERALCVITVHAPRNSGWDVDNRCVSYAINALRAARVIPGDEWDKLSLLLLGGEPDKENPRTEIIVMKHPSNITEALANMQKVE